MENFWFDWCMFVCVAAMWYIKTYRVRPWQLIFVSICISQYFFFCPGYWSFFAGDERHTFHDDISTKQITCKTFTASHSPDGWTFSIFWKDVFCHRLQNSNTFAFASVWCFFNIISLDPILHIHLPFVVSLIR